MCSKAIYILYIIHTCYSPLLEQSWSPDLHRIPGETAPPPGWCPAAKYLQYCTEFKNHPQMLTVVKNYMAETLVYSESGYATIHKILSNWEKLFLSQRLHIREEIKGKGCYLILTLKASWMTEMRLEELASSATTRPNGLISSASSCKTITSSWHIDITSSLHHCDTSTLCHHYTIPPPTFLRFWKKKLRYVYIYPVDFFEGVWIGSFAGDSKHNIGLRGSHQFPQLVDWWIVLPIQTT